MATISTINVGSIANDGTGDPDRTAFQKANANFGALNADLVAAEADIAALTASVSTLDAGKQALDSDLTAISALASTGMMARTASAAYALRTITGTASEIAVTNGDGVSGNPVLALTPTTVTPGTYVRGTFTVDENGRLTAASNGSNSFGSSISVAGDISGTGDLTLTSTDAGASAAPSIVLDRDSASPASSDLLGNIIYRGEDDGGNDVDYVTVGAQIGNPGNGSERGIWSVTAIRNGVTPSDPQLSVSSNIEMVASGTTVLTVDRLSSDGDLVEFRQNSTAEGTISVSGNTVSYNGFQGSHMGFWEDSDLIRNPPPKGTWIETTDQEFSIQGDHLNHEGLCLVRIAEPGSKRVAGVYLDDFHYDGGYKGILIAAVGGPFMCRCTGPVRGGDFVRIVEPGVAGAQDDDLRRTVTAGKVWRADQETGERLVSITFEGAG